MFEIKNKFEGKLYEMFPDHLLECAKWELLDVMASS